MARADESVFHVLYLDYLFFCGRSETGTADSVAGSERSESISIVPALSVRQEQCSESPKKNKKKAANREKPIELPFMSLITQRIILRKLR